jgi:hypothetical protein
MSTVRLSRPLASRRPSARDLSVCAGLSLLAASVGLAVWRVAAPLPHGWFGQLPRAGRRRCAAAARCRRRRPRAIEVVHPSARVAAGSTGVVERGHAVGARWRSGNRAPRRRARERAARRCAGSVLARAPRYAKSAGRAGPALAPGLRGTAGVLAASIVVGNALAWDLPWTRATAGRGCWRRLSRRRHRANIREQLVMTDPVDMTWPCPSAS